MMGGEEDGHEELDRGKQYTELIEGYQRQAVHRTDRGLPEASSTQN